MKATYQEIYQAWQADPDGFWADAAKSITWNKPYDNIRDDSRAPFYSWFPGGEVNVCYNAVDRHVAQGRGPQTALIYDSPVANVKQRYSYQDLLEKVSKLAGGLASLGVTKGDRVVIYMPMIPEAVFTMLACARIGAIHSVVFGGFADTELAKRIDDAKPKIIVSASGGIEPTHQVPYKPLLDSAVTHARHKVDHCVIFERPGLEVDLNGPRDIDGHHLMDNADPVPCVPVASGHPLYILYTSGTTGVPKGVVRDSAGYMVALSWSMPHVYGVGPGDVYWAASDIGWVVGHSYIVYAPLLQGCTTILFEGKPVGTPDAGTFWRVIEEYHVNVLFTAPTALRAIKREDPAGDHVRKYDLSSLKSLFLAGERADPDSIKWAETHLSRPVIDHWWQTETGWPAAANFAGLELMPVKYGSAGLPVPGYEICILDDHDRKRPAGETGDVAIKLPLPPGCLPTLWQKDNHYQTSYLADHKGYYATGDAGFIDADGYVHIMSRTDDIINVAGHRLSTGGIEEAVGAAPSVAECAVVGMKDDLKGMVPLAFVVLYPGNSAAPEAIAKEVITVVREKIGPVAALKTVIPVKRLPKTRSGKILRATLRKIADHEEFVVPATIDDPCILDEIRRNLTQHGMD
ncbi:propionyl-CoA synthetase [Paremcibacter congregatus]|uniref:propionyl-CoA synthetase n=1 Tax=Paremcibacter congregatus TaxID=2043170 RepID=UPI003A950CA8